MGHRVRDHDLAQPARVQRLDGVAAQDAVRDDGDDLGGAVGEARLGGFDECAARVGHVVDEDGDLGVDVADEGHLGNFVGAVALLVDEGEVELEVVSDGCCPFCLSGSAPFAGVFSS